MAVVDLVVVEDPVDPEAVNVFVDGSIGETAIRFMLDTGAGGCTVPLSDSTRDLNVTGRRQGSGASGIAVEADEVIVPQLRLGDFVIEDVAATRSLAESPLSALLGMAALGRYCCEFRFSNRELEFDGEVARGDWFDLPTHVGAQPIVPVRFESVVESACWDTGAALSVADVRFASEHPHLFEVVRTTRAIDSTGVEMRGQLCRMAACRVGGVSIGCSECALLDLSALNGSLERPISFVLGMPAILQADWTFDFPRRRWRVQRF